MNAEIKQEYFQFPYTKKWTKDLIKDIKTVTVFDYNQNRIPNDFKNESIVSSSDLYNLKYHFIKYKNQINSVLLINSNDRLSKVIFDNKNQNTTCIALDGVDNKHIENIENNIFTIQIDSLYFYDCKNLFYNHFNIQRFDLILIDRSYDIFRFLIDWEYTEFLSEGGLVAIHDANSRPGPINFIKNLNKDKWTIFENCFTKNDDLVVLKNNYND